MMTQASHHAIHIILNTKAQSLLVNLLQKKIEHSDVDQCFSKVYQTQMKYENISIVWKFVILYLVWEALV